MENISQRIKYYRKKKGLTQMDVANALGIRTDNYAKYESGARIPRDDRLIKLSKILGVSYDALNQGVEQEFADLLKSHAIGAILGEAGSFSAFISDVELSSEAYGVVSEFFDRGTHAFASDNAQFYQKYLDCPSLADLITLYDLYKELCDSNSSKQLGDMAITTNYMRMPLNSVTTMKWAFCISIKNYIDRNDAAFILDEAEELAGNLLEHFDALQFFAVKVFVPYLSLIIDAVELCMNTTIDDFAIAFLFNALTPPEDDDEPCDESEED